MEHPFPSLEPPFRPESVSAADPDFPVRITRRARRTLSNYLTEAVPYRGSCLRVTLAGNGEALVAVCDHADLTVTPHLLSAFGRTPVGVPVDDAAGLEGCVIDLRSFPPGGAMLYTFTHPDSVDAIDRPGRVALSLQKLRAVHPELFLPPSAFTKAARALLSVSTLFAQTEGKPGWIGRLVGENDPGGQAEAIEAIARLLWTMTAEPAVVVSADPVVVAVYCVGFDQVLLLRVPDGDGLQTGDRLIACVGYETLAVGQADIKHGRQSYHARNWVWPVVADQLTDDSGRIASLKAVIPEPLWVRVRELGTARLEAGDRPRDGRPWLSRCPAAEQGKGSWRRAGGYLK